MMKKYIRLSLFIISLLLSWLSSAQTQAYIDGPDQLCEGECFTYQVVYPSNESPIDINWTIDSGTVPNSNTALICGFQYDINVFVELIYFDSSTDEFYNVPLEKVIQIVTLPNPIIVSTSAQCPDSLAACDKICAFNSATYEVLGVDLSTTDVTWQVQGAQSFTADGNKVEVEWGAPGQGKVTVMASSGGSGVDPLQIFCGQGAVFSVPGNPIYAGFVQIIGGVEPFKLSLLEPSNILTISSGTYGYNQFSPLATGSYSLTVTSADGQTASCNFSIQGLGANCWISAYPIIENLPSGCNQCDGAIKLEVNAGGGNVPSLLYSIDGGLTYSSNSNFSNLCPGDYEIVVFETISDCFTSFNFNLTCPSLGCSGESSLCVEILEEPKANLASTPSIVNGVIETCQGQSVYFENESSSAASYIWDFGDLNTSTQFEPDHVYQTPGSYTVSLIARNACYCSDTTFVNVNVVAAEVPEIQCTGTVCEGESVTYSTDANCSNFNWNIGSGGIVLDGGGTGDNFVTVEWLNGPEGVVSLAVSGCAGDLCSTPNIVPIPILSENAQIQGRTSVCEGSTEEYFIPDYQGTEITWSVIGSGNIMDGQGTERITVNWFGNANQGNPQKVIVAFDNCYLGCQGKDTLDVNIVPSFYAKGPIEVCEKTVTEYNSYNSITDASVGSNWEVINTVGTIVWSALGVSTANIDWSLPIGTYTVRAIETVPGNFCNEDYDIFVKITAAPAAVTGIDGATEICPGQPYAYQANGFPTSDFNWTVTGGTPANFKGNPFNITWVAAAPYEITVTQTATTGLGCTSDPVVLEVNQIQPFSIDGASQICLEETGTYTVPVFENVDYQWTISPPGMGSVIKGQGTETIDVLWYSDGLATVSVAVCGAIENMNVMVQALPLPDVIYTPNICQGMTASVQTALPYLSYQWLDADGNQVSDLPNPDLAAGYYELEVLGQNGCSGKTTFEIAEWPEPVVTVSAPIYLGICPGGPLVNISASTNGSGYDFEWFESGVPVGTNSPFLAINAIGSYSVVVTDQNGCTAISNTLAVSECEAVGGSCVNGVCSLSGGGGGPGGPGGGGGGNCTPDGSFSFQIQVTGDCLTHNYLNTSVNDIAGSWNWNFNDPASGPNNVSSLENPSHTFSKVGYYPVVFTGLVPGLTGGTCPVSELRQDVILAVADFDFKTACPGEPVTFTDVSETMPLATVTSWTWDFGDPASGAANTSNNQHPTHVFSVEGTYTVTLVINEASGCASMVTKNVTVFDPPIVSFAQPAIACEDTAIPFSATLSPDATAVEWDFGDPASGVANTATNTATHHAFAMPGVYSVALTASNIYGCTNTYTDNVAINPNTLGGNIAFSQPSPICEGDNITLTAPAGGITYEWTTGVPTDQITVATAGIYDVTLTDAEGCTYSPAEALVDIYGEPNGVIQAVEYNEFGQPVAFFDNNYTVCEGEDVYLIINGSFDYSYQWSSGNGGLDEISFTDDRNNLLSVGTHNFIVTITDNTTGCTNETGPFTVTVNPKPNVNITAMPNGFLCENNPASLSVTAPNANYNYSWNTGEVGTSITVVAGGTYFAQAVNQFGCKSRSNELVINNAPDIDKIPTGCHTRCSPDTLCLPDLPLVSTYQWFYNGLPMAAPNGTLAEPVFGQSGEYFVIMTDIYGCKSRSDALTLDLFPGFGDILGNVYFDVNQNGVIDGPDTLVSGINIFLNDGTTNIDTVTSGQGSYVFPDILSTNYNVVLDTASLPVDWFAYFVDGQVELVGCDVKESFDWLLAYQCTPIVVNENFVACQGGGITYENTFISAGSMDTFPFLSFDGCDSIIIVTVNALVPDTTFQQLTTCMGTTLEYEGVTLSPGDQQLFTLTDISGCDSVVQVSVAGWPTYTMDLALFACENSFVDYNGISLYPGDQQDFLLMSVNGCDSVISVTVSPIEGDTTQQQLSACPGSTVNYQGVDLSPGDQQDFTLVAAGGCDSIVQVTVMGLPTYAMDLPLSACENSSIEYNGVTLFSGDQQDFVLTSMNGCDSVISVAVAVLPVDSTDQSLQVCMGETVDFNGQQLSAGDQTMVTLTNQSGCDSVLSISVSQFSQVTYDLLTEKICWNGSDGEIGVQNIQGGTAPYLVSLDGNNYQSALKFENLPTGQYTVYLIDDNDCEYEESIKIATVPPMLVEVNDETMVCGDEIELSPIVVSQLPITWDWVGGSTGPTLSVTSPGIYAFNVSNDCESIQESVTVNLQETGIDQLIYMPNSFSPNDDGLNDCYQGYVAPDLEVESYVLKIFDRWGNMMFGTNDPNSCWDGFHWGKQMQPAVYVWFVELHVLNCDGKLLEVFKEGDIHLIR